MKLPSDHVGATVGPLVQNIDARWLMAYAAALDDTRPEYLDTTRPGGVIGHPLFPVCYEWPLAVELREAMSPEVAVRSVHATHDLRVSRPVRAGDRLRTTAAVTSAEARSPGAYVVTRFDTIDASGEHVSTTEYGSIYRGVACEPRTAAAESSAFLRSHDRLDLGRLTDEQRAPELAASARHAPTQPDWSVTVPVAAGLAHTYTECARIWNPIHTDKAVAQSAGLPDIILHGTATLALAVSTVLRHAAPDGIGRVSRIACRFTGMVRLPSSITVEGWAEPDAECRAIGFHVVVADGRAALSHGRLLFARSAGDGARNQ
jgi:acyl dehydratase